MKRFLVFIMMCVMACALMGLAGCGQDDGASEPSSITTSETAMTETETNTETEEVTESDTTEDGSDDTTEATTEATQETTTETENTDTDSKILVAYFSWSGNTKEMAEYIAEQTGGELYEIEPETPYSDVYEEVGEQAEKERDDNARPAIGNLPESIDEYDAIFVGYPIWWHTAPMIIGTFLESYDMAGVEIYPFTQSASMDTEQFENSMEFVRGCADGANVHDGLFVDSSDTDGITSYLRTNGFVE